MRRAHTFIIAFILLLQGACSPNQEDNQSIDFQNISIITAGSTVSEVVCALGFCNQIIATDLTSSYPSQLQALPSIGYRNQIKAEGLLSLGPDLILAEEGYITADVVAQIKSAGIRYLEFEKPTTLDGTRKIIRDIAALLSAEKEKEQALQTLDSDLVALKKLLDESDTRPRVAFVLARGPETVFIAGEGTFAANIIAMAGATSVGKGFQDFVPLSPEAISQMDPSHIILFESGLESLGGMEGLGKVHGIGQSTAYQNGSIIAMDGNFLSSFGPRLGEAALELAKQLHTEN
jgi:iron complex transport system substrate-binding protein